MKKIIALFLTLSLVSVAAFGQSKGSKFFGFSAAASYEHNNTTYSTYGGNDKSSSSTTQLAAGVEYGYFISDKTCVSLMASVPYYAIHGTTCYGINLAPTLTTFITISDNCCYSPSVSLAFETGRIDSNGTKYNYHGYGLGIDLLGFTFRIKENLSLYIKAAPISFTSTKTDYTKSEQFSLKLNSGSIGLRFDL